MIHCCNIGVGAEKVKDNLTEGDDVDCKIRVLPSEGTDKRGEQNRVTIAFASKNYDVFWCFLKERLCSSPFGDDLESVCKALAK